MADTPALRLIEEINPKLVARLDELKTAEIGTKEVNERSGLYAQAAIELYAHLTGLTPPDPEQPDSGDDWNTIVSDLFSDIHHCCDNHELDYFDLQDQGDRHYREEIAEVTVPSEEPEG
jgi:hypothetical protein